MSLVAKIRYLGATLERPQGFWDPLNSSGTADNQT